MLVISVGVGMIVSWGWGIVFLGSSVFFLIVLGLVAKEKERRQQ